MSTPVINFLAHLKGTRPTWPEDMTEADGAVMGEHFVYLQHHMFNGKVLLAGPSMGLRVGVVVLQVADEAEARQIMDNDPSVLAGLHTYELHEFVASLLYGRDRLASTETDRQLRKTVVVDAPRSEVWKAWTQADILTQWFSPYANIELKVGGKYECMFSPETEPIGTRGSEGCRVLSFLPEEML